MIKPLATISFALVSVLSATEPAPGPVLIRTIALPGVEGRFDHAAYDARTHRLFFAALGNNTLEVVNLESSQRVHTITGLKKPTGVLFLGEWNTVVVASGEDGTCRFHDGTTYQERGRVEGVEDADNLRFDPKTKRIYLGYGDGALGIIDPVSMKLSGSIQLAKHPESFQMETTGPRIFVNVPDAKQIAVVDRGTGKTTASWSLPDANANFPMAIDASRHRLFIGCRQPSRLLVIDTMSGKRLTESPMSGDVDDLFYDPSTCRLHASCGEGFLDTFQCAADSSPQRESQLPTSPGARTCFADFPENWLCLAVPHRGGQAAELRIYKTSGK